MSVIGSAGETFELCTSCGKAYKQSDVCPCKAETTWKDLIIADLNRNLSRLIDDFEMREKNKELLDTLDRINKQLERIEEVLKGQYIAMQHDHDNCPVNGYHKYPSTWHGTIPPQCEFCGKPSKWQPLVTTSVVTQI